MGRKKRAARAGIDQQRPTSPFLHIISSIPRMIAENPEGLFVGMGVSHVFFFLVFLGSVATFNVTSARPFGDPAAATEKARLEQVKAVKGKPVSMPATVVYAVFSLVAWGSLLWKRRAISSRLFHFLLLVLAPGTIMIGYLIFLHLRS